MLSRKTREIAGVYTERYKAGWGTLGHKRYGNFGYWTGEGTSIDEACDAMADLVANASGIGPGDRVLEVGCGYGEAAVEYTRRYRPASVMAIDPTEVRVEVGRENAAKNGLSDVIRFQVGDATTLEFPDASFDRVIGIECALLFDTRRDFLREAHRVLVPGGGLGLADILLRKGADRDAYLAHVHFPVGSDGSMDVPENVYEADVYEAALADSGFTDVRIESITDRTLPHMIACLERLAAEVTGEPRTRRLLAAEIYREYLRLGLEYVLVSARKPRSG